jgi:C1A family cysteine protease
MVECSPLTLGCSGGHFITAWDYVSRNPLTTGGVYPYTATDDNDCNSKKERTGKYGIKDAVIIEGDNTQALKNGAHEHAIAVAIQAENEQFRFYEGGVIREGCGNAVDHAVTVVGYGYEIKDDTSDKSGYFIIKNSWGANWGEKGYVRIGFGRDNAQGNCGILTVPAYAIIA